MTGRNAKRWRKIRTECFAKSKGKCTYCYSKIDPVSFTIDHIIPQCSYYFPAGKSNLVATCKSCNAKKANDNLFAFLQTKLRKIKRSEAETQNLILLYMKAKGFKSFEEI